MFKKLKNILHEKIKTDEYTLKHYSSDGSIFKIKPQGVVLPKDWEDIFNLIKFVNNENKAGNRLSITARGKGTDLTGAPLSDSLIVRFPGYLDKILEIGDNFARVEPGVIYGDLQKELEKQGKTIPVNPASGAFCTVGGMVSNNSGGTKSVKYGETRDYVLSLKVILADGSEINTANNEQRAINNRLKELIENNKELIEKSRPNTTKNASGYYLWNYKGQTSVNSSLMQLFIGSEGTLGIIKEITFKIVKKPTHDGILLGYFNDLARAGQAVIRLLKHNPSSLEMVDKSVVDIIRELEPELVVDLPKPAPRIILYAEFDGFSKDEVKNQIDKAKTVMKDLAYEHHSAIEIKEKERLWRVRLKSASVIEHTKSSKKAIPFVEDGAVAQELFPEYIENINKIFGIYNIQFAFWGHAGNANLHVQPLIDLGDRAQKELVPNIARDFYEVLGKMKGTASGEHGDGISRAPFLELTYNKEMVKLFKEVKQIFDPLNIFNPICKTNVTIEQYKKFMRNDYAVYSK